MITVKVKIENLESLNFNKLLKNATRAGLITAVKEIKKKFEASHTPQSWPPLKSSTIRAKARLGYGGLPVLVRTGHLRDDTSVQGEPTIFESGGGEIGTDDDIAEYQANLGRDIYEFDSDEEDAIIEAFLDKFVDDWNK